MQQSMLALAHGEYCATGVIRRRPEHFEVTEQLSFEPDGQGQHIYLLIRKRNLNTQDVATELAKFSETKPVAIGYAGLKDRQALTTQWFSVDLAGKSAPDWHQLNADTINGEKIEVLQVARHSRKLKRGAIAANFFKIRICDLKADFSLLESKLRKITNTGVPNYFGEQRFGANDANLKRALQWFQGRRRPPGKFQQSIILSAARSLIFNQVLTARVEQGTWNYPISGDVMALSGNRSFFVPEKIDEAITERCKNGDISPSGPLWGVGDLLSAGTVKQLETSIAGQHQLLRDGLIRQGMAQQRRALRIMVDSLQWDTGNNELELKFNLPSGSYATSVIREVADVAADSINQTLPA